MEEYKKDQLLGQLATKVANTFRVSTLVAVGIVANSKVVTTMLNLPSSQVDIESISSMLVQEVQNAK